MRIFRTRAFAGVATAALLAAAVPAFAPATGQDGPESILPPGFGDPVATPTPAARPSSNPAAPRPPVLTPTGPAGPAGPVPAATATPSGTPVAGATPVVITPAMLVRFDMPDYARRPLALVGPATQADGGLRPDAFGAADGQYLETLMRRLDTPIASRWLSIALRRALVSRVDTPRNVNGADFAAERSWLLVRMGEAVGARAVAQSVDPDNYTPKLYQALLQAALATADPAALCPMVEAGAKVARERGWILARAMCAGLSGLPGKAAPMIASARKTGFAGGIDLLLAQKVAGTGASGRQAVTIEWDNVAQLTAWRYGLAMAGGVEIPDSLLATATSNVQSWRALSPTLDPHSRAAAAEFAAVRGVFSNAALVDLYGAIDEGDDQSLAETGIARDLRSAYVGGDRATRVEALKQLWDEPKSDDGRYGRLILTAHAAARLPVDTEEVDIDRLVASMLSAGLDRPALRWRDRAASGSDAAAMLMLADPAFTLSPYAQISRYSGKGDSANRKRRLFFAGMAGLGRMTTADIESGARSLDVKIGEQNAWTRAIGRAALLRQPGTVVLLAAVGMQTRLWRGVSPEALYHIVLALRAVGMEGEARMIAAEGIARL